MNEEIDESEFYHQDFTTASEWEMFIARMEEIIHEWKVDSNRAEKEESTNAWSLQSEKLPFADVDFILTLHRKNNSTNSPSEDDEQESKNPIQTDHDFTLKDGNSNHPDHCLSLWYGLNEYIVLSPINSGAIVTESRIKVLLSSLHIVVANINCEIPLFVQIREKWQQCYLGVYEGNGIRTNYEMIHLRRGPQHCQYLTGLVDLFKTKLMSPLPIDPIIVSVQLTYILTDFGNYTWKQDVIENDFEKFSSSSVLMLPMGVTVDPIANIQLKATWSHLPDNLIVDSENYTNFDPNQAQKWTAIATFTDQPICLLSDCLTEFIDLLTNTHTMYDCLGDFAQTSPEVNNPLDLLTESKVPTISSVLKRAARNSLTKARKGSAPLSEEMLVPMLYFLFPDAEEDSQNTYFDGNKKGNDEYDISSKHEKKFSGMKTCRMDSLLWRLGIVLTQVLHSLGGTRAFSHLWFEFVQEMRYRWEKSILIPGLAQGFPDARTCLLHQKLQMLNCCIERKIARETALSDQTSDKFSSFGEESSDEEEFFDCTSDKQEEDKSKHSLWNQPIGRLGKFEDLKLLKTGDQMYIPITQDPVPKTEDQLEEDTNILLKLGSDAAGSELRARMMSASLLSDMQSFKASNPGSILEDFIRWYSPRDWIEDEGEDEWGQKKGHLSSRMLISDNTWVEMWKSAKPVPAHRQKRLFDDTREAEKVLHFLDSRTLAQITEMLLPVVAHAAICRIVDECDIVNADLEGAEESLTHLIKSCERLSREGKVSSRRYEILVQELTGLELALSQANSLLYKFNPPGSPDENLSVFVGDLIRGREVEIDGKEDSKAGSRLVSMFSDAQKAANMIVGEQAVESKQINLVFPQAAEREFAMRVSAHRPAAYSTKSPQFLRAVLSKNEFRLAGAFSEDIVFF